MACADAKYPNGLRAYDAWDRRLTRDAPRFGPGIAYSGLVCANWPADSKSRMELPLDARGAAPILVIGTTLDAQTPYAWSRALARQLDSGVLLTMRGVSHGTFPLASTCVSDATAAYLVRRVPPRRGTVCGADEVASAALPASEPVGGRADRQVQTIGR